MKRASLKAEKRSESGKWAMRRLRAAGVVPGVVYGHGEPAVSIQMPVLEITNIVRHGMRLVDLTTEGAAETTLIRDLQWDTFGHQILHVDFARVRADERIHVEIPLELKGTAPGVAEGGSLSLLMHAVEIECLVTEIPEVIRVDVRNLHMEQSIHVRELEVPAGVTILADPDIVVVQVTKKMEEIVAPAEIGAEAAIEPEIVGRRVAAEPEEGETKK